MFEASVNKQFKARFQGMQGVVNMGPLSVLKRLFNGHKIDGYVLSNNIDAELVVMKKEEFEKLCKYIKVEIERTSNIPRAKIVKEKGYKLVEFDQFNKMPYKSVTCSQYSNYLNTCYRNRVINYQHMFFNGLNFSHYDVIYKAMSSNMGRFINNVYVKNGEKVNNILRKRELNAEEYQVALTGVAYIGNGQLNPIYLEKLCAADGSGAMAMRNKLQKYLEMTANDRNKEVKTDNGVKAEKPKKDILNWYCDCLIKSRNSFSDLRTENGPSPIVYITLNSGVNLCIYRNSDNNKHSVVIQSVDFGDKVKCERIEYNLSSEVNQLGKELREKVNIMNKKVKSYLDNIYDINSEDWYKKLFKNNQNIFKLIKTEESGWVWFSYLYNGVSHKLCLHNHSMNDNIGFSDERRLQFILQTREEYIGLSNKDFESLFKKQLQDLMEYSESEKRKSEMKNSENIEELREELENQSLYLNSDLRILEKEQESLKKDIYRLTEQYEDLYNKFKKADAYDDWLSYPFSKDLEMTKIQKVIDKNNFYGVVFSYTDDYNCSDDSKVVYLLQVATKSLIADYPFITFYDMIGKEDKVYPLNNKYSEDVLSALKQFIETGLARPTNEGELKEMYSWYIPFNVNSDSLKEIEIRKNNLEKIYDEKEENIKELKLQIKYIEKLLASDISKKVDEIKKYLSTGVIQDKSLTVDTPKLKENVNIDDVLKDASDLFDFT